MKKLTLAYYVALAATCVVFVGYTLRLIDEVAADMAN